VRACVCIVLQMCMFRCSGMAAQWERGDVFFIVDAGCCCNPATQVAEDWLFDECAEQTLFTKNVCVAATAQCRWRRTGCMTRALNK